LLKYLGVVELLLTETDALVRKPIVEIDLVTEDLYKFLSQELYEGLVGSSVYQLI
jgi:hypothetical protein